LRSGATRRRLVGRRVGTIPGWDRHGLEQLVRYCARPPISQERLGRINETILVYNLRRPTIDGRGELLLTPEELLDLLSQLVTPPTPSPSRTSAASCRAAGHFSWRASRNASRWASRRDRAAAGSRPASQMNRRSCRKRHSAADTEGYQMANTTGWWGGVVVCIDYLL
jgi:hypothetical protein